MQFSLLQIFSQSDIFLKSILLAMLAMSLYTWSIWFEKRFNISKMKRTTKRFKNKFWSGIDLEKWHEEEGDSMNYPIGNVFKSIIREWSECSVSAKKQDHVIYRIEKVSENVLNADEEVFQNGISGLATIATISPYLGLLGTVWGIMNAFFAIANSDNVSISTLAPGIAEALITTALGIFVAIFANIFFNSLKVDTDNEFGKIDLFRIDFINILSRKLDK